jgi:GAF domain-containing protein
MLVPPKLQNENARLATLRSLNILDTAPEERFDRLTRLAKRLFGVPIAVVSLVDENRQWFKSCVGLDATETPRDVSFCAHAIAHDDILMIPDARADERFTTTRSSPTSRASASTRAVRSPCRTARNSARCA